MLAILALAIVGGGCSGQDGNARSGDATTTPLKQRVTITSSGYHPARTTILVGGSVTWVNRDPRASHVAETLSTSLPGGTGHDENYSFDTYTLTWGEPYTVPFHQPGTYSYYCVFDGRMEGQVNVVARTPPT